MKIKFKPIYLKQNKGHGKARKLSFENCKNNLIAVMDSDDISCKNRFEKQLEIFEDHKKVDVVGGQIEEFMDTSKFITGKRMVPEKDREIKEYMKKRCPMNHMTVMFRRSAVERAGGYRDWFCNEDYYLWIRMAETKSVFANVPETLVQVRVGDEMAARRGGWRYFKSEEAIQRYMFLKKRICFLRYVYNTFLRFVGEVIVPDWLRFRLFRYLRTECDQVLDRENRDKRIGDKKNQKKENLNAKMGCTTTSHHPPFSVAMCVYGKDNPAWFEEALASVTVNQTVKPDEVVLVVDGPVPEEIWHVIRKYEKILGGGLRVINLKTNQGLGKALRVAVAAARNEIIARMDSDDLSLPERFEVQLRRLGEQDRDHV